MPMAQSDALRSAVEFHERECHRGGFEPRTRTEGEWTVVSFGVPDSVGVAFDVLVRPEGAGLRVAIVRDGETVVNGVPACGRAASPGRAFLVPHGPRGMRDRARGEVTAAIRGEVRSCGRPARRNDVATLVALQSALDALVAEDADLAGCRLAGALSDGLDQETLERVVAVVEGLAAPRPR